MAALNIRDFGSDRKAALDSEAHLKGISSSEPVRRFVDEGISRERAQRERDAWRAAAKDGLEWEARHLDENGPLLARFRLGNS